MTRGRGCRATVRGHGALHGASRAVVAGGCGWGAALGAALVLGGCGDQRLIGGQTRADASVSAMPDQTLLAPVERCNGLDDDGDGQLDEGCACNEGAMQPCYGGPRAVAGIGRCVRGTQHCEREAEGAAAAEASWGRCEGWAGPHAQESCSDGFDNDCDGLVDEDCACAPGASEACYPGAIGTAGVGVCRGGSRSCVAVVGAQAGTWGPCLGATTPAATDTCGDALDNDCDGTVDTGCACKIGESEACYPGPSGTEGVGVCRAGTRGCVAGPRGRGSQWGLCTGAVLPAQTEACGDTNDDDCDGTLNEGCACTLGSSEPCYDGPAGTVGVGLCRGGTRSCVAGSAGQANRWSECRGSVGPAATDVCKDDRDNDCDGTVDEGCVCGLGAAEDCYGGPAVTLGVGACKKGRRACVAGAGGVGSLWDTCQGAVLPATSDSCGDRVDNDCDGAADEGCGTKVSYPDVCDVSAPNTYIEAAIDPSDPATWYVLDREGRVLRTRDAGASFTPLCRVASYRGRNRTPWELREHARLVISQASDRTVYLALDTIVLRVEALGPAADCPTVLSLDGRNYTRPGSFAAGPFAVSPRTGHLFAWPQDGSGVGRPITSTDRGATWTDLAPADVANVQSVRSLAVDPADDAHLLAFASAGTSGGIFESLNGVAWQRRMSASLVWADLPPALRFDPAHVGRVYVNRGTGQYGAEGALSTDGGATWQAGPGHGMRGEWALEPSRGVAFRFRDLPQRAGLALERAERLDVATPSWTTVSTFAHGLDSHARLDAAGQTVLAVVGLRLWVSRDGGQTFSGPIGGGLPVTFGFSSVDSVDGITLYATSPEWHVYRSSDGGNSFTRVYTNREADDGRTMGSGSARIRVSPAQPRNVLVWPGFGAWDRVTLRTTNAFQSASVGSGIDGTWPILALSPTDPDSAMLFGSGRGAVSGDVGGSWTPLSGSPPVTQAQAAWIVPGQAASRALIIDSYDGRFYRYDAAGGKHVDDTAALSTALGNDPPADLEAFPRAGTTVFRAIGATAWMAESTDDGASFTGIPGSEGGLPRCRDRRLRSLPGDPQVLATWCRHGAPLLATSRNGGRSWVPVGGPDWEAVGCEHMGDLVMTPAQLVVTCESAPFPQDGPRLLVRLTY